MITRNRTLKSFIITAALLIATAGTSMAMCGTGGIALVPAKQAVYDGIMKDYATKTAPIENELWARETELHALQGNPNAQPARIQELVEKAAALKLKLDAERQAVSETLNKELGVQLRPSSSCPMMNGGGMNMMNMQHGGMKGGMMGGKGMQHGAMNMDETNATAPAGHAGHGKKM